MTEEEDKQPITRQEQRHAYRPDDSDAASKALQRNNQKKSRRQDETKDCEGVLTVLTVLAAEQQLCNVVIANCIQHLVAVTQGGRQTDGWIKTKVKSGEEKDGKIKTEKRKADMKEKKENEVEEEMRKEEKDEEEDEGDERKGQTEGEERRKQGGKKTEEEEESGNRCRKGERGGE